MKVKHVFAFVTIAFLLLTSQALAIIGYGISPYPKFKAYIPGTSDPLVGGLLYTCKVGTVCNPALAFPQVTYTDALGVGTNANPVVLDSNGEANVWLPTYTKMALYDPAGVLIWTVDNIPPAGWTVLPTGATEVRTSSYPDLPTAIAAIGASKVVLVCDNSTDVTADTVIPPTTQLVAESACSINKIGVFSLTINGSFSAGQSKVFNGFTAGGIYGIKSIIPQWFGVVADGTSPVTGTDNYSALQAVAANVSDGMQVYFPAGGYRINATAASEGTLMYAFTLSTKSNIEIYGAGDATKFYIQYSDAQYHGGTDPNASPFRLFNVVTCSNVSIHNMYFEGQASTTEYLPKTTAGAGAMNRCLPIMVQNSDNVAVHHNTFKSLYGNGVVYWATVPTTEYGRVHHNHFENLVNNAVNIQGGTAYIEQDSNTIFNCYGGFESYGDYQTITNNIIVWTAAFTRVNYLGNQTSYGIASAGTRSVISGNVLLATDGNAVNGISVIGSSPTYWGIGQTVSNNSISGIRYYPISVSGSGGGCRGSVVSNNTITNIGSAAGGSVATTMAIRVYGASNTDLLNDVIVMGNNIVGGANSRFGVYVHFANNITIENNIVNTAVYSLYLDNYLGTIHLNNNTFATASFTPTQLLARYGSNNYGYNSHTFEATIPIDGLYRLGDVIWNQVSSILNPNGWRCTIAGGAVVGTWATGTPYALGQWVRLSTGKVGMVIVAGTSDAITEPTFTTIGELVVDNTVTWQYVSATTASFSAIEAHYGTTVNRPILTANDGGFPYWDTNVGKMIFWNGAAWKLADGSAP